MSDAEELKTHREGGVRIAAMNATELNCHACDAPIEGDPAGRGLMVFVRGDQVEYEEPPLCERCAHAISMTALYRWEIEEEEG